MRRALIAASLAVAPLAAACAATGENTMTARADDPADAHAVQTAATRRVAEAFLTRAFIDNRFREAYETWGHPDLIQHNPHIGDGLAAHRAFFDQRAAREPGADPSQWAHVTDMLLVDGDIFAVLHHVFRSQEDRGRVVVDLWRVADGKIVEHWDVMQEIPTGIPHANGMACGQANDFANARAYRDSVSDPTCGRPDSNASREATLATQRDYTQAVVAGDIEAAIRRWFHPAYRQHSPVIGDGVQGAIDYLQAEWGSADPAAPLPRLGPMRVVAEGDLALFHYMYELDGQPDEAHVDIFRVTDGLISEHWDFKQAVPENRANANGMW